MEVVFLHYPTPEEAEAKWRRRADRVKRDNLFIEFSQMNECGDQNVSDFDAIAHPKKFASPRRAAVTWRALRTTLQASGGRCSMTRIGLRRE